MSSLGFEQLHPFWGSVLQSFAKAPERVALCVVSAEGIDGQPISYQELRDHGLCAAAHLSRLGVHTGGIVFVAIANSVASVALGIGTARLGAILAPADKDLMPEEILRLLRLYEPVVAVLPDEKVEVAAAELQKSGMTGIKVFSACSWNCLLFGESAVGSGVLEGGQVESDATAIMWLTSGTTGFPKSVTCTHARLRSLMHVEAFRKLAIVCDTLVYFGIPAWASYSAMFLMALSRQNTLVLGQGYEKNSYFQSVLRHTPSILFFWPEAIVDFLTLDVETQQQVGSFVRVLTYGGARTPAAALVKLIRALPDTAMTQGYGCTEDAKLSTLTSEDHARVLRSSDDGVVMRRLNSAGRCHGRQVRIVDAESNAPVPLGRVGSIQIFPDPVATFKAYYKNPEATAAKFTSDGWLITGDLGRLDEDGFLYVEGRDSETIVLLSGDNVYPNDVESVIAELAGVIEVGITKVVVGDGAVHEVGAFVRVTPDSNISENTIRAHCAKKLGQTWTHPAHIFIQMDKLPRNKNGKCMKSELTAEASRILSGRAMPVSVMNGGTLMNVQVSN